MVRLFGAFGNRPMDRFVSNFNGKTISSRVHIIHIIYQDKAYKTCTTVQVSIAAVFWHTLNPTSV